MAAIATGVIESHVVDSPLPLRNSGTSVANQMRIAAGMLTFPSARRPSAGFFFLRDLQSLAARGHLVSVIGSVSWIAGTPSTSAVSPPVSLSVHRHASLSAFWPFRRQLTSFHITSAIAAIRGRFEEANDGADVTYLKFLSSVGLFRHAMASKRRVLCVGEGPESLERRFAAMGCHSLQRDLECVDAIEVRNQHMCDLLHPILPSHAEVRVVGSGVDTQFYRPGDKLGARQRLALAPDEFVVAHVGSNIVGKGGQRVIHAVGAIPKAVCAIAGPGWRPSRSSNRLRVLGVVAPTDVRDLLHAADIFVLPSTSEGMPNAVLEALSCGVPVIVGARQYSDFLVDEYECLKVDPLDVDAIRASILRIALDPAFAARLSAGGLAAAQRLSMACRIDQVEQLLTGSGS